MIKIIVKNKEKRWRLGIWVKIYRYVKISVFTKSNEDKVQALVTAFSQSKKGKKKSVKLRPNGRQILTCC